MIVNGYDPNEEFIGSINLSENVYVSDPCYQPDDWFCNILEGFKSGKYNAYILCDSYENRVAEVIAYHEEYDPHIHDDYGDNILWNEDTFVAVDSGQAGFFDADYFERGKAGDKMLQDKGLDFDKAGGFYKDCCNATNDKAGIIGGHGIVSQSGYGDGIYPLLTAKSTDDKIVAAKIMFIDTDPNVCEDDEDDWNNDEEDDEDDEL